MKPVERLEAVFAFEKPDRVPIYDKLRNEGVISSYAGEPFAPEHGLELGLKACRAALDATANVIYPQQEWIETAPDGFEWTHKRWTSWITRRPFSTVQELAAWVNHEIERLDGVNPSGWPYGGVGTHQDKQALLGDTVDLSRPVGVGLNEAYHRAGLELFSYLMADEPVLLSRWLEALFRCNVRSLDAIDVNGALHRFAMIGEDIACNTGTLFSPAFLRREFFPRLRQLVGAYHELGFKVVYHSDGNLNAVLDDLVATGIDGLNPIEVTAGMNLALLKERYGRQLVLVGGMDASELLPRGTVDEVREATLQVLQTATPGSGYILASTTELSNAIPPENIIVMWETAREFERGGRLAQTT